MSQLYDVFTRTWWAPATGHGWPGGRMPKPGRKSYKLRGVSWEEARRYCDEWNRTHNPGRWSRKCEFESR